MTPEHDPAIRDRVIRLMGVLRQLALAKHRPLRHTSGYARALWLGAAQEHCTVQFPSGPGQEVLRVSRVQLEPEPERPRGLGNWVQPPPKNDPLREPVLKERGPRPGVGEVDLADAPEVRDAFGSWMRDWRPWAERERLRRPRQEIFETLFDLHRLTADRPESIELVLCSGLLRTPGVDDADLRIHLITQPLHVEQDLETGDMVCTLADDSVVRLEDDELLSDLPSFDLSGSANLRERLIEQVVSPIDPALPEFLKEWATRTLRIAHTISDTWNDEPGPDPRLTMTPAIVARPRGAYAIRAYYDAMSRALADQKQPVPLGLAQLVEAIEPHDRVSWLERSEALPPADLAEQPLFPLPANEEQAQIIRRLGRDSGVVVEGPPGTGKTHTIANLVSALLAQGQRVLVTSEKAQALRVLRDKLPPAMQELCVSLTDASAKGNSDLAKSVATLAGRKTDFHPERADREIVDLERRRADIQHTHARLMEKIRAVREEETYQHPEIAPGYQGTLAQIAQQLNATAEHDGWLGHGVSGELPLTTGELDELLHLLRSDSDQRRARRGQQLPEAEQLLSSVRFAALAEAIELGEVLRSGDDGSLVAALERLAPESLAHLGPVCEQVAEAVAEMRALPTHAAWTAGSADRLLAGSHAHVWQRAVEQLALVVDSALEHDRAAEFARVHVDAAVDPAVAAPVFERLAAHLAAGGSMRRLLKSAAQKEAERFNGSVLVEGAAVATAAAAAAAAHHLRVLEGARRLDAAFGPLEMGLAVDADRPVLVERMLELRRSCGAVERVLDAVHALRGLLMSLPATERPAINGVAAADRVAAVAIAASHARNSALARVELDDVARQLLSATPPAARAPEMDELIEAHRTADPGRYDEALASLEVARREQADQSRCDELYERTRQASPSLAGAVLRDPADAVWAPRLRRWPQAWAHACATSWIDAQTEPGLEHRLEADLEIAVRDASRLTASLAAAKAWRSCLSRMSAEQVQALQSYRNAMANVGKGTGKFAERFRESAREAMTVAQAAVPAWVMPIQQVLASVAPTPNVFDVVIVDEASQAELTSIFLLWLAPRVIVVGDDKQCTPSEVSSGALQPVLDRIDAELHDVPAYLRTAFTPRDSIFSLLRSRFGQVVRLREHFRCMPEIITWSSNEFYRDAPLVPLRQFGADRLPPLRTSYVEGGFTEGVSTSLVNPTEADAIAASVAKCLDDPAYDGKTFGVVVLQGQAQVDAIRVALMRRVGPHQWEERRVRVGTPPDFQGDERHVVWLSLVVAPNSALRVLSGRTFEQRFNVGASRAQDQLWLFHSVTADLLRPTDLRRSLLDYMTSAGSSLGPVHTDVLRDRPHDAFDSLFEQRVYLDLLARGYHVTPQVETNGRRIDLVVTGAAGKLAVECDGEAFHTTPEQRTADLHREQELKRCGWTFERIRESVYYRNKEAALAPVWEKLDQLGIGPLGDVSGGTWVPRPAVVEELDAPACELPVEVPTAEAG
ncbi:AAA domain-containing protein [Pseudonocardia bannensis]|uniref:AAA family ATPase n=1 Tax=Pseudonocardia bannensis TaxID=630973 RepID=A0A848DI58_9PSEU|nr:AAA domain-containing protein [Pseudonocardia bannensis]NMH92239.1 AAA family ATPase [Pseudonocardia bannensis]